MSASSHPETCTRRYLQMTFSKEIEIPNAIGIFPRMLKRTFAAIALVCLLFSATHSSAEDATNRFGFAGPEIFPVENLISQLKCADIDGDGLNDLLVVNNARSKITILYNQTGKTNDPA